MKKAKLIFLIIGLSTGSAFAQSFINPNAAAALMRIAVPPDSKCNINAMGNPFCKLTLADAEMDMWVDGASIESQAKFIPKTRDDEDINNRIVSGLLNLPLQFGFSQAEVLQLLNSSKPLQKTFSGVNWSAASAVVHKDYILRYGRSYEAPFMIWKEQIIINTAF